MKYIIIGQIMFWLNIASIITGYLVVNNFMLSYFTLGLIAFVGTIGSCVNLFFAVAVQVKGYNSLGILDSGILVEE